MRRSLIPCAALLLMAVVLAACAAPTQGPMTWLDRPLDGAVLPLGPVTVQAHASDADGVASFEFFVDDDPLVTAPAAGGRLGEATVGWTPTEPGTYTIRARGIDTQGNPGSDATSVVTVGELPTASPAAEGGEIIFLVEPEAIPAGGCAVLYWEVRPPADALLDGEVVPPTGEREVCPEATRTYELLVPETGEMRTVRLHVEAAEGEVAIFFAVDPDAIPAGGCAMLLWEVGAPEEWRTLIDGEQVPHVGEREVCPARTTTYELLVEAAGGPQSSTVTLNVEQGPEPTPPPAPTAPPEPTPPPSPTAPPGCPGPPVISSFAANPSTITAGQSSTLSWGPVTNGNSDVLVRSVVINPGLGEVGSPGSRVVQPATTTTYTLVGTGCGGTSTQQVTIVVEQAPPTPEPPFAADLAITDLYPETLYGPVGVRITNHGPGTVNNVTVQLSCQWEERDPIEGYENPGQMGPMSIGIGNLAPGQTQAFNTGIAVDLHVYQYDFSCSIQVPFNDPNQGNNSYSESFS